MKPITAEWVAKAEGDFNVMNREADVEQNPNFDAVCFHAQQCTEKYLKAKLCEADISFGKIHDLVALLEIIIQTEPDWERFRQPLAYLTEYAVSFRYPGESADLEDALEAQRKCTEFRKAARTSLGL